MGSIQNLNQMIVHVICEPKKYISMHGYLCNFLEDESLKSLLLLFYIKILSRKVKDLRSLIVFQFQLTISHIF